MLEILMKPQCQEPMPPSLYGNWHEGSNDYSQTQLPPDYIDLEKRVDALKIVHQKMLAVT